MAKLCPNMIHVDAWDFSECRSVYNVFTIRLFAGRVF